MKAAAGVSPAVKVQTGSRRRLRASTMAADCAKISTTSNIWHKTCLAGLSVRWVTPRPYRLSPSSTSGEASLKRTWKGGRVRTILQQRLPSYRLWGRTKHERTAQSVLGSDD